MSVLNVNNVSICYVVGDFKQIGLKEYIIRKLKKDYHEEKFWADKDITFSLEKGDMLGIVGTNGAGKSTLLKAVTGIMPPTQGSIKRTGRIAALLELTSGFDGELTVKENAFLRGALLGYEKKYMQEKYKEIIEFAELEEFENRKFNQLSSGMKSRLAFSVACLVDPDILILDEVLSVGDGAFREKSSKRMKEILGNGVTGILVSHSISQVRDMCNKVLWLDKGKQIAFGEAKMIMDAYEDFLATPKKKRHLPLNIDEIKYISESFDIYQYLAAQERAKGKNVEFLINETANAREQRWMKKIKVMDDKERQSLLDIINN